MTPLNVDDFLLTVVLNGGTAWPTGQRAIAINCIISVSPDPDPARSVLEILKGTQIYTNISIQTPFAELISIGSQR